MNLKSKMVIWGMAQGFMISSTLLMMVTFMLAYFNGGDITVFINRYNEMYFELFTLIPFGIMSVIIAFIGIIKVNVIE